MRPNFVNAFYIKLGLAGKWEADSIATGKLRLGWEEQTIKDINNRRWDSIGKQLRGGSKPHTATNDLRRLKDIVESTPEDIWVTFHQNKLWWTRLSKDPVHEDGISKYRVTARPWSDKTEGGKLLVVNDLPGKLAQLQGFRGTACRVSEVDLLRRLLAGASSPLARAISRRRSALAESLALAIKELHWKDFETLVDLIFRHAGWLRVSVLGQQAKGYDLELREPITGDRYVVQVKSQAALSDLNHTLASFSPIDYRRVFFVVHSPDQDLASAIDLPAHVEIVRPALLANLAVEAGLASWLEQKMS